MPLLPLAVGAIALLAGLAVIAALLGLLPGGGQPSASPTDGQAAPPGTLAPPAVTPLAEPPAEPAGDGTRAIIEVPDGRIVIELFNRSSPVAAQNFINLAEAGFYDGILVHRIVPGFVVQAGDPTCRIENPSRCTFGMGSPGYTIPDEPVVGQYVRGTVAMARSQRPNSQGSQFFIVLQDAAHLAGGGYAIFGRVVEGMDVVDRIAAIPTLPNDAPEVNYQIDSITIERPS